MSVTLATWLVHLFTVYVVVGTLFAALFVWRGVGAIDPVAKEGSWGFRLLILPGCAALWPLLLHRWWSGSGMPPEECSAHRVRGDAGR
jgi:hypothetical protein